MRRLGLFALPVVAAAFASACVVVPIDPRTGQPIPYGTPNTGGGNVTVIAPPPAAPQPVVLSARLYPVNEQAGRLGMLTAVVVDKQGGRGSFSVSVAGDTLQGEATRVDGGYASFGRVHDEVLGASRRAYSGQRGIANGAGSHGLNVQCEYLITGPGIGTGACLFSDGARYQMHFGG